MFRLETCSVEQHPPSKLSRRTVAQLPLLAPFLLALCVVLAAALLTACSEQDTDAAVSLRISTPDGSTPARYRVIFSPTNGTPLAVTCPDDQGAQGALRCSSDGAKLQAKGSATITVKAPGFHWRVEELSMSGGATVPLRLEALPPFEATADYRTGISAEDGLAAFEELAFAADTELGPALLVKFQIRGLQNTDGSPPELWFQNTRRHPLHYEFASQVLGITESREEYEENTNRGDPRPAMIGTIVHYPQVSATLDGLDDALTAPFALTFFPRHELSPSQALCAHRLLEERLLFAGLDGGARRVVYLPAGSSQERQLEAQAGPFAAQDALWTNHRTLYGERRLQVLNEGVAYGTLRRMSPEALRSEVVSFQDVLVLTRLPNELPIVGGVITEEFQTPLAHVNVAARTRGTPNLALLDAGDDPRVAPLLGKLVRFEVAKGDFTLAPATLEEAQVFWDSQGREPFVPEAELERDGLPGFDELSFADARTVGVKAANLAELHRLLPEQAPNGFAVPFHYYDRFLHTATVSEAACALARQDCVSEGRSPSLCERAQALCSPPEGGDEVLALHLERLLADEDFRSDSPLREACLDNIRHHMRNTQVEPAFAEALDARVRALFGNTRVRLRSSTNAEDLEGFSGAGLYSSYSAGVADPADLPSMEIRKVWASVWNWRAFEERAFCNIDHLAVRMAVAVHPAFPDEAVNGVLLTQNIADPSVIGMYANVQLGEVSVTNPEDGATPEVFSIIPAPRGSGDSVQVVRLQWSSLSPETPLMTQDELTTLYGAARQVQEHFAQLYRSAPSQLILDLEFKLHGPDRSLTIKQVRSYSEAQ